MYCLVVGLARLMARLGRSKDLEIIVLRLRVPETRSWLLVSRFAVTCRLVAPSNELFDTVVTQGC